MKRNKWLISELEEEVSLQTSWIMKHNFMPTNLITYYKNPTANLYLMVKDWIACLLRLGISQERLPLPLLYCTVLEILANVIKQEKLIKGMQIINKEIKLSLFADHTWKSQGIYKKASINYWVNKQSQEFPSWLSG